MAENETIETPKPTWTLLASRGTGEVGIFPVDSHLNGKSSKDYLDDYDGFLNVVRDLAVARPQRLYCVRLDAGNVRIDCRDTERLMKDVASVDDPIWYLKFAGRDEQRKPTTLSRAFHLADTAVSLVD